MTPQVTGGDWRRWAICSWRGHRINHAKHYSSCLRCWATIYDGGAFGAADAAMVRYDAEQRAKKQASE